MRFSLLSFIKGRLLGILSPTILYLLPLQLAGNPNKDKLIKEYIAKGRLTKRILRGIDEAKEYREEHAYAAKLVFENEIDDYLRKCIRSN